MYFLRSITTKEEFGLLILNERYTVSDLVWKIPTQKDKEGSVCPRFHTWLFIDPKDPIKLFAKRGMKVPTGCEVVRIQE